MPPFCVRQKPLRCAPSSQASDTNKGITESRRPGTWARCEAVNLREPGADTILTILTTSSSQQSLTFFAGQVKFATLVIHLVCALLATADRALSRGES